MNGTKSISFGMSFAHQKKIERVTRDQTAKDMCYIIWLSIWNIFGSGQGCLPKNSPSRTKSQKLGKCWRTYFGEGANGWLYVGGWCEREKVGQKEKKGTKWKYKNGENSRPIKNAWRELIEKSIEADMCDKDFALERNIQNWSIFLTLADMAGRQKKSHPLKRVYRDFPCKVQKKKKESPCMS